MITSDRKKTHRGGCLDPAGVGAAAAGRGVLGHVGRCAAVFTAQGQALGQPQQHEEDRREKTDLLIGRQGADQRGRQPHHHDGHQKGVFAAHEVANAAEDQRAKGPTEKPTPKSARLERNPAVSLPGGKNSLPKNTASVP